MTAEFAITTFAVLGTGLFFLFPRIYGRFAANEIVNVIITRCFYVIGLYLMVLNSAMIGEIASTAGYSTGAVWRYMWLFGTFGYLLMFYTGIKTLFDINDLYKKLVNSKRGLE